MSDVIGIGIDLVDIDRIERMWQKHGRRAVRRLLTDREQAYCLSRAVPARHIAARLAAKEAAFKAMSGDALDRRVGWLDLEVIRDEGQSPEIRFHGNATWRAGELGVQHTMLTMTHTERTAGAVVVMLG